MIITGDEINIWIGVGTVLAIMFSFMWGAFLQYWLYPKYKKWLNLKDEHSKEIGIMLRDELNNIGMSFEKENFDIHIIKGEKDFQISDNFILALKHLQEYSSISKKLSELEGLFNKTKNNIFDFKKSIQDKIIIEYGEECKDDLFKAIRKIINKMWDRNTIKKIEPNQLVVYPDLLVYFNGEQIAQLDKNKFDKERVKEFFLTVLNNADFQNELKQIKINYNKLDADLKKIITKIDSHSSDIIKGKEKLKRKICDDCLHNFWLYKQ